MEADNIENELLDMISDLDDDLAIQDKETINQENVDPLDLLEDIDDNDSKDMVMKPIDVRKIDDIENNTTVINNENPSVSELSPEIEKYRQQLDIVTAEVLASCRADRQEAQEVIDDLSGRMKAISGTNGPPPKSLVDGLVKAVEVKAGINLNAIKIMDTNARFLSAIKPNINKQNNLNIGSSEELRRILDS